MKISKYAFETKWEGYLRAIDNFDVVDLFAWQYVPIKRVEILIRDEE